MAKAPEDRRPCPVYAFKMTPELASRLRDKHQAVIKLPRAFSPGARLFLREWVAGPTGRADLCMVFRSEVTSAPEDAGLYGVTLSRRWCWWQGKIDDKLEDLGLLVMPDEFPILGVEDFIGGDS